MNHSRPWVLVTGILLVITGGAFYSAHAQDGSTQSLDRPVRVYVDCDQCYTRYLRRNLTFVSYVRDRKQADVHILGTTRSSGGGGTAYRLDFIGRGPFEGQRYDLTYNASATRTRDERRRGLADKIRLGMVPFVTRSPVSDQLQVSYEPDSSASSCTDDSWNNWVFEIGGSGDLALKETEKEYELEGDLEAERITEAWKIQLTLESEYERDVFERENGTIRSVSRDSDFGADVVKSVGSHWGAGVTGTAFSRTFTNTDLALRFEPAVEYNVFPYSISDQKKLTVTYRAGPEYRDYREETIFGRQEQFAVQQFLRIGLDLNRPWGSVYARVEGGHYFFDLTKNRAEFFTGLNVQLIEGLSLGGRFNVELIQDQVYLPAGDPSLDEILLRRREQATDYEIQASLGLSYTFGSIYNNVVNTRL